MRSEKIMTAAVCGGLAVTLTACGGGIEKYADSPFVGEWIGTIAEYNGKQISVEEMLDGFTLNFEADGSVTADIGEEKESGRWDETENGLIMTDDSDSEMEFSADGDELIVEQEGITIHFEKQ